MSSKKNVRNKYLAAASDEQIFAAEAKINAAKRAARKPSKHKVDSVMETVVRCLSEHKSSRRICKIVADVHKFEIKKDSILRFKKSLESITSN